MAYGRVHVSCAFIGGVGTGREITEHLNKPMWSETLTAPGVTTNVAPFTPNAGGTPTFEIRAGGFSSIYVAIGPSPDASQAVGTKSSARLFIAANTSRTVICTPGDKLAWAVAPDDVAMGG